MTEPGAYIQVCIPAPDEGLSGALVASWVARVIAGRGLEWVAVTDLDVAGDVRPELAITAREIRCMRTSTLLPLIQRATQVVWASLFFCRAQADAMSIEHDESYEVSTQKATVTVRVVDASYLYVIGRESELRGIQDVLPPGDSRIGMIEEMEFPE